MLELTRAERTAHKIHRKKQHEHEKNAVEASGSMSCYVASMEQTFR